MAGQVRCCKRRLLNKARNEKDYTVAAINHALHSRVAIYYSAVRHRRSVPQQSVGKPIASMLPVCRSLDFTHTLQTKPFAAAVTSDNNMKHYTG